MEDLILGTLLILSILIYTLSAIENPESNINTVYETIDSTHIDSTHIDSTQFNTYEIN